MKYLTFDIETLEDDGISCAAALPSDTLEPVVWRAECRERMGPHDVKAMIHALMGWMEAGYQIVTWNGLGFDFRVMAEQSGYYAGARHLAQNHVDMMFQFFCETGFNLALKNAAAGLGVEGKLEGMSGAAAPEMWRAGQCEEVITYLKQDVRATMNVCLRVIERKGGLIWRTKKGGQRLTIVGPWLTVAECLERPLPQSQFAQRTRLPRESFFAWMSE